MYALILLITLLIIIEIFIHTQINIANLFFSIRQGDITFQWKNKQSLKCSDVMAYDHLFWDVERISNSPPIETYITPCPIEQDVARLYTPDQETNSPSQSSFIRTISHMITIAFEKRNVDSMQIGIIKSVRQPKDVKPGNELAFVYCNVSKNLTTQQIGKELKECLKQPINSTLISSLNFIRSDMIFNSWRNAENFSNKTSNTQLIKTKNTTDIDFSKSHLYTVLSNDNDGWYIVEHDCIHSIAQHMHQIHVYLAMLTIFLLFYLIANKPCTLPKLLEAKS